MSIVTIGLDLAKSVFQVHGIDASGRAELRRRLSRDELVAFFARQPPCLVGMEVCSSANHWACDPSVAPLRTAEGYVIGHRVGHREMLRHHSPWKPMQCAWAELTGTRDLATS